MLVESQPGWLLHSRKYTDSKVLVDFLTRDHGRISGVARLPRRKKQMGAVLSFTPYLISWRGRSQLKTITALEPVSPSVQLLGQTLYCGFYLNEVLLRVLAMEDECEKIFIMYRKAMDALVESLEQRVKIEITLRHFELDLVQELGFGLNFEHDANGAAIDSSQESHYRLLDGESFVQVLQSDKQSSETYFAGDVLRNIAQRNFSSPETLKCAKILCRQSLYPLIGERPLQSREFFK